MRLPPETQLYHSLPVFEGVESRRHVDVPFWKLRLTALPRPWVPPALNRIEGFVQFVGFPRSGHSLIGALIDAHPAATISHELDAMGLVRAGFGYRQIARLVLRNAAKFARDGKWWNGYCYAVPGAPPAKHPPRLVGDKKGDWAARWCARTPGLLERFAALGAPNPRWLLVTRAPADNIATMSLRRGGVYDRLRIAAARGGRPVGPALAAAQAVGDLPRAVSDEMIADYHELCTAIAAMKAGIPPDNWLEIDYDAFTAAPRENLCRIAGFLGLAAEEDWTAAAAALVRRGDSRSRERLAWRADQLAALDALARDFDFLRHYGRAS